MKNKIIPLLAISALFLVGCVSKSIPVVSSESTSLPESITEQSSFSSETVTPDSSSTQNSTSLISHTSVSSEDFGAFQITTDVVGGYASRSGVFTITKSGTYLLSGALEEGRILIDVPSADTGDIILELAGVSIRSIENSPIYCASGEALKIKTKKGTENYIIDAREAKNAEDETQGGGAIYSKCDTNFTGAGTLNVSGAYNNGVHVTKDLKIKSTSLNVTAINTALKGNDSVTISSGTILAKSTGGDGIKTEDSDISSKGKQRGTVQILGGKVDIYSWSDGIDSAYDTVIDDGVDEETGAKTIPVVNIYTNKYAGMTESEKPVDPTDSSKMYIRTKTSAYSTNYRYSLQVKDQNDNLTWVDATYEKSFFSGRSTYYYYSLDYPSNAKSFRLFKFNANASNDASTYVSAMSDFASKNISFDTFTFSENGKSITEGGWCDYKQSTTQQGGPGGGGWGGPGGGGTANNDKASDSAKGIKANNNIYVKGGKTYIKSYDDGLHANYYQDNILLDNGEKGLGDVNISGGELTVNASDDGIHADRYVNIDGGITVVETAYEGIEGSVINISAGSVKVYATDDGLNAANKADTTALINITGGFLDVAVSPNGDTDGIDSNGDYKQSGGVVVSKGPYNTNMAALDWGDNNNTATVSGGTLILFGKPGGTVKTSGAVTSSISATEKHSGIVPFYTSRKDGLEGSIYYEADCYDHTYTGQYIYSDQSITIL